MLWCVWCEGAVMLCVCGVIVDGMLHLGMGCISPDACLADRGGKDVSWLALIDLLTAAAGSGSSSSSSTVHWLPQVTQVSAACVSQAAEGAAPGLEHAGPQGC